MPVSNDDYAQYADLVKYVHGGDWHSTGSFLNQHPQAINEKISSYNWTALHMATRAGKVEIVGNLVELMSTQALAIQDSNGNTALHLAAVAGITKMSRYMVEKNEETRSLAIVNNKGYLPLTMACANGHRDATVYLSSKTPFELLSIQNPHGSLLLQCSISNKMPGIHVPSPVPGNGTVDTHILNRSQHESKIITQQEIKQIHDLKLKHAYSHAYSLMVLHFICEQISLLDESTFYNTVYGVFMKAIERSIIEPIVAISKVYPMVLYVNDAYGRTPMMQSIVNRQEKVFNLFCAYRLELYGPDIFGNILLHFAGMHSPSSPLTRISGAALQMQRELKWYKRVETIYQFPAAKLYRNNNGETAAQLFTKNHKQLVIEGEKWMKDTATSRTVVGALIITIMFTAAFTLPGGNVQDIGIPIFLHKMAFKTFIVSDTISLFSSSTSVKMFLGILTSRYGEQDFFDLLAQKVDNRPFHPFHFYCSKDGCLLCGSYSYVRWNDGPYRPYCFACMCSSHLVYVLAISPTG